MIRIDAVWLATEPLDMRAGMDSALARVVQVFGAAHPHTAYLFANRRTNRMKVLVHDGVGIWLAARRLHQGHFVWPCGNAADRVSLSALNSMHWYWDYPGAASGTVESLPWCELGTDTTLRPLVVAPIGHRPPDWHTTVHGCRP